MEAQSRVYRVESEVRGSALFDKATNGDHIARGANRQPAGLLPLIGQRYQKNQGAKADATDCYRCQHDDF